MTPLRLRFRYQIDQHYQKKFGFFFILLLIFQPCLVSALVLLRRNVFQPPLSDSKMHREKHHSCRKQACWNKRLYMVSELHIPGYAQTKLPFISSEEGICDSCFSSDLLPTFKRIPYDNNYLIHETVQPIFTPLECEQIINESEYIASQKVPWTTNRHGNYPTTDLPIIELPETLQFLRRALVYRVYPNLRAQFGSYLPDPQNLRVADGFIVKYDAQNGQKELKPHRDGSVLSFNIALNPSSQYNGGGTWFASLPSSESSSDSTDVIQLEQGHMLSHASALLHGGHPITSGIRYILVAFVILEDYDSWSMRFYNQVRNL